MFHSLRTVLLFSIFLPEKTTTLLALILITLFAQPMLKKPKSILIKIDKSAISEISHAHVLLITSNLLLVALT